MATYSFHSAVTADVNIAVNLKLDQPFAEQVKDMIEQAGAGLKYATEIAPIGQSVGSVLSMAALELAIGLPTITVFGFGADKAVVRYGSLNLSDWRHNVVRPRRSEIRQGEAHQGYTVIDGFGKGLTEAQMTVLTEKLGTNADQIRIVKIEVGQIDYADPTKGIVDALLSADITSGDWDSGKILFIPPGFGLAGTLQGVAINGLTHRWAPMIRLAPVGNGVYDLVEIVDPNDLRQWGAELAAKWANDATAQNIATLLPNLTTALVEQKGSIVTFTVQGVGVWMLNVSSAAFETAQAETPAEAEATETPAE